jgi:alkanesulfonate monooxygenase SsuD/methylene tetrahydromethanopterin reductase-like flavin-dependent oxidoreductase (luciferase family)
MPVLDRIPILDGDRLSFGYLLPTRDAVTLGRPAARPLIALGQRAEQLGFDAVWVGDSPLARARHDALAMLAGLATQTQRVALGTAVLLPALRSPLLLGQAVATIDQLAEGRVILGAGAGFPYPETQRQFDAVGVPFAGRVGRLRETIAALRALWASPGEPISYHGRHLHLDDVALSPPPHRPGGPPVWLAGAGEVAERRVGRLADGWLPYPPTAELYAQGWQRVRAAATQAGRDRSPVPGLYATVALDTSGPAAEARLRRNVEHYYQQPLELIASIQAMYAGTPEGFADWLAPYLDAGARHIILRVADEDAERGLEAAAQARNAVRGSRPAVPA